MVIEKGHEWGEAGVPHSSVPSADSDRRASALLAANCREFVLTSGDMARTMGAVQNGSTLSFWRCPVDLLMVRSRDHRGQEVVQPVLSHAVLRSSLIRGGIWRGSVVTVCNAQYLHGRDIAPRGHPNDGRVDILAFAYDLSLRERVQILSRLKSGEHIPHPKISVSSCASECDIERTGTLILDGVSLGTRTLLSVWCEPDEVIVWIPRPFVPDSEERQLG